MLCSADSGRKYMEPAMRPAASRRHSSACRWRTWPRGSSSRTSSSVLQPAASSPVLQEPAPCSGCSIPLRLFPRNFSSFLPALLQFRCCMLQYLQPRELETRRPREYLFPGNISDFLLTLPRFSAPCACLCSWIAWTQPLASYQHSACAPFHARTVPAPLPTVSAAVPLQPHWWSNRSVHA
jgi:hypothetical protein